MSSGVLQVVVRRSPVTAYPVMIGSGMPRGWSGTFPPLVACHGRVVLVSDAALPDILLTSLRDEMESRFGTRLTLYSIGGGESLKSLEALLDVHAAFARAGLRRDGLVIAAGGGTVGDLVGFAAATWHRGVPWVPLPTTLLAQVDSAVGGKVGINIEGLKNLVGVFHQPAGVVVDVAWLPWLPRASFLSGIGEVLKYALGMDRYLWEMLQSHDGSIDASEHELLVRLIRRCLTMKARHVAFDEHDNGIRRQLNLGHTFAHALEGSGACTDHGTAVALGLIAATRLGVAIGLCDPALEADVLMLAQKLGLATRLRGSVPPSLTAAWDADKKHGMSLHVVVVPTGRGSCRVVDDPPQQLVREAMESLFVAA